MAHTVGRAIRCRYSAYGFVGTHLVVVTAEELDRAIAAGKARWTWVQNLRPARCVLYACRRLLMPGAGRQLWIDGHARGYICDTCRWDQSVNRRAT